LDFSLALTLGFDFGFSLLLTPAAAFGMVGRGGIDAVTRVVLLLILCRSPRAVESIEDAVPIEIVE
jgi:hypothetical protein